MTGEQCALDHAGVPSEATHRCAPAATGRGRLARPLEMERTWGHAPHARISTLDRFESAVAFAIREATRLQHERESGRVVTRTEAAWR
jgi:hypothetical protein